MVIQQAAGGGTNPPETGDDMVNVTPVQRVLLPAAGRAMERARAAFALDNACAQVARVAREPMMAQIRLAWWRDGIAAETARPEHRSAEMDALRAIESFDAARPHLVAMIDGWEELILHDGEDGRAMLGAFAAGRGAGLFGALFPDRAEHGAVAGRVWALWDLAGHLGDEALVGEALELAREALTGWRSGPRRALPRLLAMMVAGAAPDVARGRGAPAGITPGLYARLLRAQIFGR